ncbi:MAG: hypothetical protein J6A01_10835 [Proteobacteria bacterium]|nr:hypothetical protein [Pseudomonadota bacterium]
MTKYTTIALFVLLFISGCHLKGSPDASTSETTSQAPQIAEETLTKPMTGLAPIQDAGNILGNAGFEQGLFGWKWLDWSKGWAPFALSTQYAYEGKQSLYLPVLSTDKRPTVVWGGVQEITLADDIPECVDGYYYVENWSVKNWKQYLQFVVIDLSHDVGPNQGQAQLRYIISGSKEPPLSISNAQYLFMEKERRDIPVIGKWTHFSVNPRADYEQHWKYRPGKGATLRILFEGRFDYHKSEEPARGDVYFDNLYFGPKTATRCNGN